MNVKEKDLVQKALTLADSVGERVASGYWLEESQLGQLPIAKRWRDIAYGDGKYVVVGYGNNAVNNNEIVVGDDSNGWHTVKLPTEAPWQSVCYGNGVFVAVAGSNSVSAQRSSNVAAYSTDGGETWTQTTMPISAPWSSVAYGNGVFVAVNCFSNGSSNMVVVATSSNGKDWAKATGKLSAASAWENGPCEVIFGGGKFYTFMNDMNGRFGNYSEDGETWTKFDGSLTITEESNYPTTTGLAYGNGILVEGGANTRSIYYFVGAEKAQDASYLYGGDDGAGKNLDKIAYGNGVFVATRNGFVNNKSVLLVCDANKMGDPWEVIELDSKQYWQRIKFVGRKFILLPKRAYSSDTGTTVIKYSFDGRNWFDGPLGDYMTDYTGTDKTTEVLNALNGIQTNTLDAAYTAGVNAYQGE